jgi:cyclohexa-1,5-dienecarbonyl-CoA hydratase
MTTPLIRVRSEGRASWITLDRPPLNVLNIAMMRELSSALAEAAPKSNFLVFEGAGARGFSAGAEVGDHAPDRIAEMLGAFHGLFRDLWRADCITISAVHGVCLGGGCELATFCDFVVAGESAKFGQPEIKLACFPPVAMAVFAQFMGPRAAFDLILTGRTISAAEARELGLVSRLVPDADVQKAAKDLVGELSAVSPFALRMTRRELRRATGFDFEKTLEAVEKAYVERLAKSQDYAEGIRAFLEKRPPVWQGR